MPGPLQRAAVLLGLRKPTHDAPRARDERSLLQVLLGALFGGVVAGALAALLGSGTVAAITFGFLLGLLFLWMDLKARNADDADGPPGA